MNCSCVEIVNLFLRWHYLTYVIRSQLIPTKITVASLYYIPPNPGIFIYGHGWMFRQDNKSSSKKSQVNWTSSEVRTMVCQKMFSRNRQKPEGREKYWKLIYLITVCLVFRIHKAVFGLNRKALVAYFKWCSDSDERLLFRKYTNDHETHQKIHKHYTF